jgi:phosphoribosyl-ATP pyrophosphohydrolase
MRESHIRTPHEVVWGTTMDDFTIYDLERRVDARAASDPDVSYTRKLLDRGTAHCAKKFGEEAVETVLAAVSEDRDRLIGEAADLLYHLLVVLKTRDVSLAEVEAALAQRTKKSGLEEKASRKGD